MSRARIVAAATGLLGLLGLGLTLLPLVTVSASERLLRLLFDEDTFWRYWIDGATVEENWDFLCKQYQERCPGQSSGQLDVNAYDLIASGVAVSAIVPVALALAVAIGALSAWRVQDSRVFGFVSLASLSALAVLAFTTIKPSIVVSGSGEFGDMDSQTTSGGTGDLDFSIGAGLYLPAAVLTVIFLLNAWQAISTLLDDRRPEPVATAFAPY
ncbi:hypothetical protein [Gordonia hydrophobica]|uniref:Uncharacterized protein n=1 Tax=Gordonia hydrophobica TaxID=40516 RepID=A0ABZ2U5R7_9ACTN|nr:hypothetical protein [Gordonia hydrophobica]MBM7368794.1 hypothetical protein [Gordonia hydrophobica]